MIGITSDYGYIGTIWWINSNPSERQYLADSYWQLWGTFGIGRKNLRIALEPELAQESVTDEHYEWELQDSEGEWQAGGSANDLESVRQEGLRYLLNYSQDAPHKLIIRHHQTTTLMEMATPNVTTSP